VNTSSQCQIQPLPSCKSVSVLLAGTCFSVSVKMGIRLDQRIFDARRAKVCKRAMPMFWRLLDLRRTGDTLMNDELGIDPHVVEAILNHVSGSKSAKDGVAGIYNKAAYLKMKKETLDAWAAFILAAVATSTTPDDRPSGHQDGARIDEPATALPSPAA
jgi:hypothetical protein